MNNKSNDYALSVQQSVINTINKLLHHLSEPETSAEYIHRIRVDIKHLRAWLRLLRIKEDKYNWKQVDQNLFKYAKQLGSTRDAQAITDTLNILNKYTKTEEDRNAIIYVQEQLNPVLKSPSINWKKFKTHFSKELNLIKQNFTSFDSILTIKNGLKHTYSKAIQLGEKAFSKNGTYDDLHKFRKWVKYLNYQLAYLNKRINIKNDIDKLGDNLGKIHDLIIIKEKLKQLDNNKHITLVCKLIDKNIHRILKKSKQSYGTIFNKNAEKFVDDLSFI